MTLRTAALALLAVVAIPMLSGCGASEPVVEAPEAERAEARAVVLVSIDGFRWDYLDRSVEAPVLRGLAAAGVRAERLVPVFPTKTFPNHYSLVTGLHPEAHGIVGNSMRDPERLDADGRPETFSLSDRDAVTDGAWWGGEPIWATAQRQGKTAATLFWPGSEAEIGGVRPTHYLAYDRAMAYPDRVDWVLARLDGGFDLATLYFEIVDDMGHRHGPDSPEVDRAVEEVDALIGRLVDGLRERGRLATTDLVVTSDHGMTAVSRDRVVFLDDAVDYDTVDVDWGETVGLWPDATVDVDAMIARVSALDHVEAFRKEDLPSRLHHSDNARIPPVVVLVDAGWTATSRDYFERRTDRPSGGGHGWDNAADDMHGLFVASGPSFRTGVDTGPIRMVDVYAILAGALGVDPAPNDGDVEAAARVLRRGSVGVLDGPVRLGAPLGRRAVNSQRPFLRWSAVGLDWRLFP